MIDYKALKGDPTDNIPGVPGVGEKTAAKLIREFGTLEALYERIDEVKPDKLRDKLVEHRDAVFMGKDLSTIVRDLPVDFDLEAARLGDYDRETVIRLFREYEFRTLIERLPAMTGETAGDAAEALRGVATDGSVPAARVAGAARPSGWGSARPVRPPSEGGGLQLSLDFDAVGRPRGGCRDGRRDRGRRDRAATDARPVVVAGDLPTALAAAITDPSRIEVHAGDRIAALEPWLAAQAAVGIGLLLDDPRPRRGSPLALALAGTRRPDGRGRGPGRRRDAAPAPRPARRPRSSATRSSRSSWPASPTIPDARRDAGRVRHPDRGLRPQCVAAQPDHRRRRRRAARPHPAAGRRARQPRRGPASRRCPPSPSASRSSGGSWTTASTACTARSSCR